MTALRRLLALDPGSRRIGVAISDELGMYAHPRPALDAGSGAAAVANLVESEKIDEVIVGLPISMSGRSSAQTDEARAFAALLRRTLPVPVLEWDERLSSVEADRRLGGRRDRRSGERDSAAAALILQAVLDSRRGQSS